MMLDYESVKDKPKTLRAMTSLDRSEFEELCNVFSEVGNEHTHQHDKDPAKGGRKPILKTIQDRLFFILFYLQVYRAANWQTDVNIVLFKWPCLNAIRFKLENSHER